MSDLETFTQLPLKMDPQSKAISALPGSSTRALDAELTELNNLHRALLSLETPFPFPPPPMPVNPKRSAAVAKFRDSGNDQFRRGQHGEAIKHYSLGLQAALTRPLWEPSQLCREEVAMLYANRAQAEMSRGGWVQGMLDAECSVEAKKIGNAKAWWRRGKCLMEMGRLEEAKEWVGKGLELEGQEQELAALLKEIEGRMARKAEAEK